MSPIHITENACIQYCERINPRLTLDEAWHAIAASEKAICFAAANNFSIVIQSNPRAKLVIKDLAVVTVLSAHHIARRQEQYA